MQHVNHEEFTSRAIDPANGFRTLAIQKRSGEVWGVLTSVKSEFDKSGGMFEKAQKNIQAGLKRYFT